MKSLRFTSPAGLLVASSLVCGAMWSVSASASAADSPIYIFGMGTIDPSRVSASRNGVTGGANTAQGPRGTFGGELGLGYRFSPNLATEVSVTGGMSRTGRFAAGQDFRSNALGVRAGVLGILPLTSNFEAFVKTSVGYEMRQSRFNLGDGASGRVRQGRFSPAIGIGASYYITPQLALRVEYEYRIETGRRGRDGQTYRLNGLAAERSNVSSVVTRRQNLGMIKLGLQYAF